MDIKNLFDKTKSNKSMLNEYEKNGKEPVYLYFIKEALFEEITDKSGNKDYETKHFVKGISLLDSTTKEDAFINSKLLIPYDYINKSKSKPEALKSLFNDVMKGLETNLPLDTGLKKLDAFYRSFLSGYKKKGS